MAGALAAALTLAAACGKKAPLRLPDQRPAESAATPRAIVRSGRITLEFSVPSHRVFPEREEPWVLARVLRRQGTAEEFIEAGVILESGGFDFGAPLEWSEEAPVAGVSAYRVEFRDAARRRRALSEPVEVAWQRPPGAPGGLRASGDDRAVILSWSAPEGVGDAAHYRVYRREVHETLASALTPAPLTAREHSDTKVEAAREYCYRVSTVSGTAASEIEGPASEEICARTDDATPPPPPSALRVTATPGAFLLSWEAVAASDLLGYRVYRAVGEGPLELITPAPVQGNAFREETPPVPASTRFRYVVTAVDGSARRNESPFSPAAEALSIPAP